MRNAHLLSRRAASDTPAPIPTGTGAAVKRAAHATLARRGRRPIISTYGPGALRRLICDLSAEHAALGGEGIAPPRVVDTRSLRRHAAALATANDKLREAAR